MTKSMTEGSPLKQIIQFALPVLLGNIFQQTYNIADAAIVGRFLGANSLGAVGVSTAVQLFVLGFCTGSATGFSIPVATSYGAEDYKTMRKFLFNGAFITTIIALSVTFLTVIFCHQILTIIKTPLKIYKESYLYLVIIFAGIPFTLLYNFLSSVLRAIGDSRTPFIFLAISSLLNIVLDLTFILIFNWGVGGAACATILSQAVSGVLCIFLINKKFPILHLLPDECKIDKSKITHLIKVGLPMGLQFSSIAIGTMVMQAANNSLGTLYVSAFAVATKIKQFTIAPFDALAVSIATFMSQNNGAEKSDRICTGFKIAGGLSFLYGIISGTILHIFGREMSLIFISPNNISELNTSWLYLRYMGMFYWALGMKVVIRTGVQGLGYANITLVAGLLEMCVRTFVSYMFISSLAVKAICYADPIAWVTSLLFIAPTAYYCTKKIEKRINTSHRKK